MSDGGTKATPQVSIVTSCYNRLAYCEESIATLLGQTHPDFEVVVVDDGSTDGSGDWLASLRDPRLTVLRQANQGNGMGLNAAIAASRGPYIAIFDFGDLCDPDRIARQAALLDREPDIGVVGCWVRRRNVATGDVTFKRHRKDKPFAKAIFEGTPFTHGEVMYRRNVFEAAGRYRRAFRYAVDRDLFVRMSRHCDYAVIEADLYEQRLFPDGISSVPEKLILQAYFSHLATECGRRVARGETDLVEQYGESAGFFLKPSAHVASRLDLPRPLTLPRGPR